MKTKRSKKHPFRLHKFWIILLVAVLGLIALHQDFSRHLRKLEFSSTSTKISDYLLDISNEWIGVSPPSAEIERLAIATTMTPNAEQIFYQQNPTIEPKETFFQVCQKVRKMNDTLVLFGCYSSNSKSGKIAIQSVTDTRFQGLMEVTAAHEMLHAAYSRLSLSERNSLTPRLKQAALRITNERLSRVLKQYEEKDSALFINELHSYIGTELDDLGDPELEQYYQRYFRDRNQVVMLAQKSQETVRKLDETAKQLKSEINALEASLTQTQQTLKERDRNLESQKQNLDKLRSDLISFKEQTEQSYREGNASPGLGYQFEQMQFNYNEKVREFNEQLRQHQDNVAVFKEQFENYQQKVNAYNEITHQERELFAEFKATSLDSTSNPSGNQKKEEVPQVIEDLEKLEKIMDGLKK
ncbi:hypothetical protein [Limnofasciculus baicalensis]|uniref:Uncharacterized protein n=1 Tax=Limnofasciculus baicalensis BBK-W-15 TaxID=2699891 RepID=A0AAE3GXR5_9CYAN|nr:hypothetical protein [Limnofasciculus baicalensis]MCP2731813.1 hypothetical protein [Limnofasciculus baicalensis BBK-W-15]